MNIRFNGKIYYNPNPNKMEKMYYNSNLNSSGDNVGTAV
jgi:hypothetical protein